jgi:hypothetical protein
MKAGGLEMSALSAQLPFDVSELFDRNGAGADTCTSHTNSRFRLFRGNKAVGLKNSRQHQWRVNHMPLD